MTDDKLVEAMARAIAGSPFTLSDREWERIKRDEEAYADRTAEARAALAAVQREGWVLVPREPVAWRYRFSSPFSGDPIWRLSADAWNGQRPTESQALYAAPQPEDSPNA